MYHKTTKKEAKFSSKKMSEIYKMTDPISQKNKIPNPFRSKTKSGASFTHQAPSISESTRMIKEMVWVHSFILMAVSITATGSITR